MKDDFYYDGPDDEIIDEDRIGKTPNDDALLSFIFGVVSIFLVIFMRSGILAIIFGAVAWTRGNKAMYVDRKKFGGASWKDTRAHWNNIGNDIFRDMHFVRFMPRMQRIRI